VKNPAIGGIFFCRGFYGIGRRRNAAEWMGIAAPELPAMGQQTAWYRRLTCINSCAGAQGKIQRVNETRNGGEAL
jgi:hypothetical protein